MIYLRCSALTKHLYRDATVCIKSCVLSKATCNQGTYQLNRSYTGFSVIRNVRNRATSREKLKHFTTRGFSTDGSRIVVPKKFRIQKLPFESESIAHKDIVLYTFHGKERTYFFIGLGGIFFFLTLLNSAELIYRTLRSVRTPEGKEEKKAWYQWWKRINFKAKWVQWGAPGSLFIAAFLFLGFSAAYPALMVREITLLKGGERVLLEKYRAFGYTKAKEYAVKDISARWGRPEAKYFLPLRIRGKRIPSMLSSEGVYYNQKMFDQTVGLFRF